MSDPTRDQYDLDRADSLPTTNSAGVRTATNSTAIHDRL
jgi:hypothetical protein